MKHFRDGFLIYSERFFDPIIEKWEQLTENCDHFFSVACEKPNQQRYF